MTTTELVTIKDRTCHLSDGSKIPLPDFAAVEWSDHHNVWVIWSMTANVHGWIGQHCDGAYLAQLLAQLETACHV